MTRQEKMLKSALIYREQYNFSIIPSSKNKIPLLKRNEDGTGGWKEYEERYPTVEEINKWWGTNYPGANISLVCGKLSNRVVVDVDTYKNPKALELIEDVTPDSLLMPIVDTPRGGEHRHFLWDEKAPNSGDNDLFIDVKSEGGLALLPPSVFQGKEYAWRNGFSISKLPTPYLPDSYISFFNNYIYKKSNYSKDNILYTIEGDAKNDGLSTLVHEVSKSSPNLSTGVHKIQIPDGKRDVMLFHLANYLIKSGMNPDEVRLYLLLFANNCCEVGKRPYTEQEAIRKVESALQRGEVRIRNLAEDVREFIDDANGVFMSTEVHKYTQVSTRKEKKNISEILRRLVEDGLIERHGSKNGCFRKINKSLSLVNFNQIEEGEPVDIRLPFALERYVEIEPGDIVSYSAPPNAGKTAIMIECVKLNMRKYKTYYWSTEIGRRNIRKRIAKQDQVPLDKWNFEFSDDFGDYTDAIKQDPNGLHIIDYVEMKGDQQIYEIPKILTSIHDELKNGVAIIALQMNKDKDHSFGGQQTLAKPSLAVMIKPDFPGSKMTVLKAKNHRTDENPYRFQIDFKIVKGINLIPQGVWGPEV